MATSRRPRPAPLTPAADSLHTAGRDALRRGAWEEARTQLEASIADSESPEALEDLGLASWWLDDAIRTFDARERAYVLYRDRGDARGAARVAIWLVWDCLAFRNDFAVASGWLERARRILEEHTNSPEFGWLLIREGEVALFRGHDPRAAIGSAERAAALGRVLGDQGVEFTALALEGLARVSVGDVEGGMRRLDEATVAATAGEVKELYAVGLVCCWQIFACERVRDFDRAAQWCARVQEFTKRWGLRPLSAVCRTQYAGVLIWRGDWAAAEAELTAAARELEQSRPGMSGSALARLGELRLRQGRVKDAEGLFAQAPSQPQSRIGLAALMLERGNAEESLAILEHHLGQLGAGETTARAAALELSVRAHLSRGDALAASYCCEELEHIASAAATGPFAAAVASARGAILLARGAADAPGAVARLEVAVEQYERSGAPFETARARLDLAAALEAVGRRDAAEREARLAARTFDTLGAAAESERARAREREIAGGATAPIAKSATTLTARQVEILKLVAQGLTNAAIARRLKLSEHTVKRHVANLLTRLGLSSRAAAAVYAAREGLL